MRSYIATLPYYQRENKIQNSIKQTKNPFRKIYLEIYNECLRENHINTNESSRKANKLKRVIINMIVL